MCSSELCKHKMKQNFVTESEEKRTGGAQKKKQQRAWDAGEYLSPDEKLFLVICFYAK